MRAADIDDVARLCGQLGYPSAPDAVARRFGSITGRADHGVFVAELEGRAIGWLHVAMHRTIECDAMAEILGVVVDEAARNRGVGARLIDEAERWAAATGCSILRVRSRIARDRAHAFYERAGYQRVKTQHVFEKSVIR
jgi:GNAT superfamily N-acetyltransferase